MDHISKLSVKSLTVALVMCLVATVKCEMSDNGDGTGTIKFEPPTLNDEESHSRHMPDNMKCDACKAIAYQFTNAFDKEHKKSKKHKMLLESDIYRIVEDVCTDENMREYGVKEVKGERKLSGPGLPTAESPGIMQGGGMWPNRMERLCGQYVEEFDEETIYEQYEEDPAGLEQFLCKNDAHNGLTNVCLKKKGKNKKKKNSKTEL